MFLPSLLLALDCQAITPPSLLKSILWDLKVVHGNILGSEISDNLFTGILFYDNAMMIDVHSYLTTLPTNTY